MLAPDNPHFDPFVRTLVVTSSQSKPVSIILEAPRNTQGARKRRRSTAGIKAITLSEAARRLRHHRSHYANSSQPPPSQPNSTRVGGQRYKQIQHYLDNSEHSITPRIPGTSSTKAGEEEAYLCMEVCEYIAHDVRRWIRSLMLVVPVWYHSHTIHRSMHQLWLCSLRQLPNNKSPS